MKCALELQIIATVREEEIRKEKEEAERKKALAIRTGTIAKCESIGSILEEMANNGKQPCYDFCIDKYNRPLIATNNQYADRRLSYHCSTNPTPIDFNLMKEWFAEYCFEISAEEFSYYHYGFGVCEGHKISIKPSAECLKNI